VQSARLGSGNCSSRCQAAQRAPASSLSSSAAVPAGRFGKVRATCNDVDSGRTLLEAGALLGAGSGAQALSSAAVALKLAMMPPALPLPTAIAASRNQAESSDQSQERLLDILFPGFDTDTFVWRISLLQITEYVGSLLLGSVQGAPKLCSLYLLGASWGPAIAGGALWRLFLPMMLHANALHIFFNLFFQLRIGFGMEKQFGRRKFCLLYVFCGFLGNLISVMTDPMKLAVGASTSGFGLLGVWMAEILLTWDLLGESRPRVFLWLGFMLLSCVMMSTISPNVDFVGHFGGALAGFLMAIILADMREEHQPAWYQKAKTWAKNSTALIIAAGLIKVVALGPDGPFPYCGSILHPRNLPF